MLLFKLWKEPPDSAEISRIFTLATKIYVRKKPRILAALVTDSLFSQHMLLTWINFCVFEIVESFNTNQGSHAMHHAYFRLHARVCAHARLCARASEWHKNARPTPSSSLFLTSFFLLFYLLDSLRWKKTVWSWKKLFPCQIDYNESIFTRLLRAISHLSKWERRERQNTQKQKEGRPMFWWFVNCDFFFDAVHMI